LQALDGFVRRANPIRGYCHQPRGGTQKADCIRPTPAGFKAVDRRLDRTLASNGDQAVFVHRAPASPVMPGICAATASGLLLRSGNPIGPSCKSIGPCSASALHPSSSMARYSARGWTRTSESWKNFVRPSRPRFARHLRMRHYLMPSTTHPHAEERPGGAGSRLEARTAPDAAHSCPASPRHYPARALREPWR
jgi:hypothetical protein